MTGSVPGQPAEPVAWTFQRADGGRSFYMSMGHPGDFENPAFVRLLTNAIAWAAGEA
jgi:type 1 glutamine amidotransferase